MHNNRISKLISILNKNYQEAWDTCCDHGKIGIEIFRKNRAKNIYFIDIVPSIIEKLRATLDYHFPNSTNKLNSQVLDASKIKVLNDGNIKLICICGVGGKETIEILKGIIENNDLSNVDFLLSPHYNLFEVRTYLIEEGFTSIDEQLIKDGKWFYEVLYVSKNGSNKICNVGSNLHSKSSEDYFKKVLNHYLLKSRYDDNYQHIYQAYLSKIFGQS
ncbi:tRNA (adenine(22)-N(1))-methyltransferase TrmK [Halobacteriovorax sp. HLS]|uniref:tRNA (adenine(22)-N(1))-methyltransferase TrmK n=1 Tax=Halobacteriovorax sp. HLS TaxID=2234000 RepID=UPI000FD9A486|nr:tRNA (adenine(22)-N(1))-methyltransferase TrmK [Halobacteriovorax sp. HLS]